LNKFQRGPLVLLLISRIAMSVFFIGFVFDRIYSPTYAIIGVVTTCVLLIVFAKKIKHFYAKIELRFLSNFNERENSENQSKKILTPWDTHLSTFELGALSPYTGKTLFESKFRENFGVNIAKIERGDLIINVPNRNERIYPFDKLSVIGSDEQLNNFKNHVQTIINEQKHEISKEEVSLEHFLIEKNSILVGKSIKSSNIRELTKGLVVGIEKGEIRILNPDSDYVFDVFDTIWIVGNKKRIQILSTRLKSKIILSQ